MRKTILAVTVFLLGSTAVMALTAGRAPVGAAGTAIQNRQIARGDVAGQGGSLGAGNIIIAKGDKSGTGPGRGGHKGAHKGEHKGGQKHG